AALAEEEERAGRSLLLGHDVAAVLADGAMERLLAAADDDRDLVALAAGGDRLLAAAERPRLAVGEPGEVLGRGLRVGWCCARGASGEGGDGEGEGEAQGRGSCER